MKIGNLRDDLMCGLPVRIEYDSSSQRGIVNVCQNAAGLPPSPVSIAAAIRHLAEAADLNHARSAIIEIGGLEPFERPLPAITNYDGLLSQEVAP